MKLTNPSARLAAQMLIAVCLLTTRAFAQSSNAPGQSIAEKQRGAKKDAADAFRNGDQAAGLAALTANLDKRSNAPDEDIQLSAQLREISHWLANEKHPRAQEAAAVALTQTNKAKGKASHLDQAELSAAAGMLYETMFGDLAAAKVSYQAALTLNAAHADAARGIARIQALESLIQAKARQNEALRQRPRS